MIWCCVEPNVLRADSIVRKGFAWKIRQHF
jgi:hypothetical protein